MRPERLTRALLERMRVPGPGSGGDKEVRGRVLVVGGQPELPGAVLLAGEAALRAGAGKLRLVCHPRLAPALGCAVPEAAVYAADATSRSGWKLVQRLAEEATAVLVGPGLREVPAAPLLRLVQSLEPEQSLVLDAGALPALAGKLERRQGKLILTPHAGEMASFLREDKKTVERQPAELALRVARELDVCVVLKGERTFISDGRGLLENRAGNVGLATSGSGDVLAGLVAGLAARGAPPLVAAAWGVHLHARAGEALAREHGTMGYLARELLDELRAP